MKHKIFLTLFFAVFFNLSLANAKTSLNCTQSKLGNLKNQNIKLVIFSDLKKTNSPVDVEINNQKFTGEWNNVFDQMLNENIDVIQGEKEIDGLIHFFSFGPKRNILGYEIIDQQNEKKSQFGLLGCK